jgi:hypothetical protein
MLKVLGQRLTLRLLIHSKAESITLTRATNLPTSETAMHKASGSSMTFATDVEGLDLGLPFSVQLLPFSKERSNQQSDPQEAADPIIIAKVYLVPSISAHPPTLIATGLLGVTFPAFHPSPPPLHLVY